MIEGALIALAGVLVGRFFPGRRRRAAKPQVPSGPLCGCTHHRSFHPDGRGCSQTVYRGGSWKMCGCGEYVGPEPLPEYYAPEIGGAL